MADGEVLVIPNRTVLRGIDDGESKSTFVWASNTGIPVARPSVPRFEPLDFQPGAALISGNGTFGIESVSIEVTSTVAAVLYFPPIAKGSWARNVNITEKFPVDVVHSNGSAIVIKADDVSIENSLVVHGPDHCRRDWGCCQMQQSVGMYINSSDGIIFRNNTMFHRCQGYELIAASRVLWHNNTIISIGTNLSNGNGINNMIHRNNVSTEPKSTKFLSFLQNYQTEAPETWRTAPNRYESWTTDGPSTTYFGPVKSTTDHMQRNITAAGPLPNPDNWTVGFGLGAMVVVDGEGAGQIRQANTQIGNTFLLDQPLSTPLRANSSRVVVLGWKSHFTLAGNTFVRGTTVQLFGGNWYSVFADNIAEDLKRSGRAVRPNHGFSAWGRSYGAAVNPCLYVQFIRNTLVDSGFCRTTSFDDNHKLPKPYLGAGYNRGHVHRRNILIGTNMTVEGSVTDILVEGNVGTNGSHLSISNLSGLHAPVNVLMRYNTFDGGQNTAVESGRFFVDEVQQLI